MSPSQAFKTILLAATACFLVVTSLGFTDHKPYRDAKQDECRECHRSSGVMDSHGAFFLRDHRGAAEKASNNCNDCHPQSYCQDCHQGGNVEAQQQKSLSRRGESRPVSHRTDFISTHPIKAADDPQSCHRCHEPQACADCHTAQLKQNRGGGRTAMSIKTHKPVFAGPGVPDPTWVASHRADARRNLASCQSCHPQKIDCSNFACHPNLGGR